MIWVLDLPLLGCLMSSVGRSLPATTKLCGMPGVHPDLIAGYVLLSLVFSLSHTTVLVLVNETYVHMQPRL